MAKIIKNHTIEEYYVNYGSKKYLTKIPSKDVESDKRLLGFNTWWLIGDTYYEIPKKKFLSRGGVAFLVLLIIGGVAASGSLIYITFSPLIFKMFTSYNASIDSSVSDVSITKQELLNDGRYQITICSTNEKKGIKDISVRLGSKSLVKDSDYTFVDNVITISKNSFNKVGSNSFVIKPTLKLILADIAWNTKFKFYNLSEETTLYELAKTSTGIYFGNTEDYADKTKDLSINAFVGEDSSIDKIYAYYDNTDSNQKLYIVSDGKMRFTNEDIPQIGDYRGLFYSCGNVTNIVLNNVDLSNVSDFQEMFKDCKKLTSIDGFGKIYNNKVNTFYHCFDECNLLTSVDLSNINLYNVKDMDSMFCNCYVLKSVKFSSESKTENIGQMRMLFENCSSLEELDLSMFKTSKVHEIYSCFQNCTSLKTIYASEDFLLDELAIADSNYMFSDCTNLVGGNNTKYDEEHTTGKYAHIDVEGNPGYFTDIAQKS